LAELKAYCEVTTFDGEGATYQPNLDLSQPCAIHSVQNHKDFVDNACYMHLCITTLKERIKDPASWQLLFALSELLSDEALKQPIDDTAILAKLPHQFRPTEDLTRPRVALDAIQGYYRQQQSGWAQFLGLLGIKNNVMRATTVQAVLVALNTRESLGIR
jgi:hypothetical protein